MLTQQYRKYHFTQNLKDGVDIADSTNKDYKKRCLSKNASNIQQGTNIRERLLNKPYVNEVTLTEQNPP